MLQACVATAPTIGDNSAKTVATGAAGGGNAQNANAALEKCQAPLGTIAIVEDKTAKPGWERARSHENCRNAGIRRPSGRTADRAGRQASACTEPFGRRSLRAKAGRPASSCLP